MREEEAGGRDEDTHSTTPTYTVRRDCPAREPSWSVFWLQKTFILIACVREEEAGSKLSRVVCGCEMTESMERSGGGSVNVGSHK